MKKFIFAMLGVFAISQAAHADATQEAAAVRATILQQLSGYESVPTRLELDKLGPQVAPALVSIAQDPEASFFHRQRALAILGSYEEQPEVGAFLEKFVGQTSEPEIFIRTAVVSLGRVQHGKAVPVLEPFLASQDPLLREAVVNGLLKTGDAAALPVLERAYAKETEGFIKDQIQTAIQELRAPAK